MSRYIDADALTDALKEAVDTFHGGDEFGHHFGLFDIEIFMHQVPTVDVVKHGHWIWKDTHKEDLSYGGRIWIPVFECSVCGHWYESYVRYDEPLEEDADYPKYCECCGSRMDGEEE